MSVKIPLLNIIARLFQKTEEKIHIFNMSGIFPRPPHIHEGEASLEAYDNYMSVCEPSVAKYFKEASERISESRKHNDSGLLCAAYFYVLGIEKSDVPETKMTAAIVSSHYHDVPTMHIDAASQLVNVADQLLHNRDRLNSALFIGLIGSVYAESKLVNSAQDIYNRNAPQFAPTFKTALQDFKKQHYKYEAG